MRMLGAVRVLTLVAVVCACGAACTGSAGGTGYPAQSATAAPGRPIPLCGSAVHVPEIRTDVVPSAAGAPTAVLQVGAALTLTMAAGAALRFTGPANSTENTIVCRAAGSGRQTGVLVALAPGYVRVAVQPMAHQNQQKLVLIKVTS